MTHFVLSGTDFLDEKAEELKKEDKKLIILLVLEKYCRENNSVSIRYSELRDLSDVRLSEETNGFQTNFGGAFEIYVKEFEKEGYLKRYKKSPKNSLIIPDKSNIETLVDKKGLKNYFDRMDIKTACQTPFPDEGLLIGGGILLHKNFPTHLVKMVDYDYPNYNNDSQNSISLFSIPWKIYIGCDCERNFILPEQTIQKLLGIGKTIALKKRKMPFRITLEYNGPT